MIKLNDITINVTMFPDNTSQVWKLPEELLKGPSARIIWEYHHEGELMQLAQLKELLDATGNFRFISLYMPYLPYGRQDKYVNNESTFALRTFATLINSLNFREVSSLDPHSDVAIDLINSFRPINPDMEIDAVIDEIKPHLLAFPDAGATQRYRQMTPSSIPAIIGNKVRDQKTGWITDYSINHINKVPNSRVLVIDDICDGGMTFKLLAKKLFELGASEVNLYVTHGIFSKGLPTLRAAGINRIFTREGEVGVLNNNITYKEI